MFVLFGPKTVLIAIIEVVLWILKFFRYRAIYFKPCFILFKARIIHSIMQLLTDWLNDMATLNKCWIRGNKGKHILLHIINKEKIAKKPRILFESL